MSERKVRARVVCGVENTFLLGPLGRVYASGYNGSKQLGLGSSTSQRKSFTKLSVSNVVDLAAGYSHTIALDSSGKVYGFGKNTAGQLGNVSEESGVIADLPPIHFISTGNSYSIAVDHLGQAWGLGTNGHGELGLKDLQKTMLVPMKISNLICKQVVTGIDHTIVLDVHHNVWLFGRNLFGQLGFGDTKDRREPILNTQFRDIQAVFSTHGEFTIAIDTSGTIWACGNSRFGQLEQESDVISIPTALHLPERATFVTGGVGHIIALDDQKQLWGIGRNQSGELGIGTKASKVSKFTHVADIPPISSVSAGGHFTVAIDCLSGIWVFGKSTSGALGLEDPPAEVRLPTLLPTTLNLTPNQPSNIRMSSPDMMMM